MTDPDFDARAYLDGLPVLEDVEDMGRAVVFVGRNPEGGRVLLEVPRPLWLSRGVYLLPVPVQPAQLTVYQGTKGEAPAGLYTFALFDEDPASAALLKKLEDLASA